MCGACCKWRKKWRRQDKQSTVTLICDGGERYQDTYYHPEWVSQNIGDIALAQAQIREWTGL